MKKFLLSMFTPVLALLPVHAQAEDETCQVGRQVFEFVPTGETLAFRNLRANTVQAEEAPERMSTRGYLKIPDIDGESRAATGYRKIDDIAGESQRGEVYPKVEGVRAAETTLPTAMDKSTPKLIEAVTNGTHFVEWHPDMMADMRGVRPPLIETTAGAAFIKIGDIKGESLSAKYIDKSTPILMVKASCDE